MRFVHGSDWPITLLFQHIDQIDQTSHSFHNFGTVTHWIKVNCLKLTVFEVLHLSKMNLMRNVFALLRSVNNSVTLFLWPEILNMYTSTCLLIHETMLEQHSESDWHRSSHQFSIWFQDNSHILKTPKIQYIVKISSVSQNIKPNVFEYQ